MTKTTHYIVSISVVGLALLGMGMARNAASSAVSQPLTPTVTATNATSYSPARVAVYFSPNGGATDAIVKEVNAARQWIKVQAYSFTSPPILDALKKAHERGVKVSIVLDKSNQTARYTGATFMQNAGVEVLIDDRHAIAHNKIIIIDGVTLLTGSFNFTKSAEERNAENLLVIKDCPALINSYNANFQAHLAHSKPYMRG